MGKGQWAIAKKAPCPQDATYCSITLSALWLCRIGWLGDFRLLWLGFL
jgi:hypothetical protein